MSRVDPLAEPNRFWLPVLLAAAMSAAQPAPAQEPPAEAADVSEGEAEEPRLHVHGFLSQAFAVSDGPQILGITEDGTSDYRAAALQMRYRISDADAFVAQLSHERLGESVLEQFREDVEVDWIFYEHRWESSAMRVGRVPIPFGIWNEVRDVGTVLPFFRPPRGFYGEGAFASETVDGLLLSHTRELGAGFALDADLYFGDWQSFEVTELGANEVDIDDSTGIQLWLQTPYPGLRFGLGSQRFEVRGSLLAAPGTEDLWEQVYASVEGQFDWFVARGEIQRSEASTANFDTYYVQLGFRLGSRLRLNLQVERSNLELLPPLPTVDRTLEEELVVGLAYQLKPYLVIKAEVHEHEGFVTEDPVPSVFEDPVEVTYGILSLSTSF